MGPSFFDAGPDGLGLGREGCETVLALSLEMPFVAGGNDVIADALWSGMLAFVLGWRAVEEKTLSGEIDAE